jgi:hypothetical protein
MPISVGDVIEYLEEFKVKEKNPRKNWATFSWEHSKG